MYIQEFTKTDDIIKEFEISKNTLHEAKIYLAWYGYGSYDGQALVIYEKDGKLFEVNASHCSCYGLEGQWQPEETTWGALSLRKIDDDYTQGSKEADIALQAIVKEHLCPSE